MERVSGVDEQIRAALGLRQKRGFFIRQLIVFQCLNYRVSLSGGKNLGPIVVQMGDILGFGIRADLICQQVGCSASCCPSAMRDASSSFAYASCCTQSAM